MSQKTTAICVVDAEVRRVWRGTSPTDPGPISQLISRHAGVGAKLGVETGAMTPWLVHGLRATGLDVAVLDGLKLEDLQAKVREARMVDAARDLAAALRDLPIGRFEYAEFEGEDHAGALTAGTGRGISFALRLPEDPD